MRAALLRGGPYLDTRSRDGENFILLFPKEIMVEEDDGTITRLRMPANADSDGASIPGLCCLVSKVVGLNLDHYGDYWPGAFVHDCIYRRKLEKWNGSSWEKAQYERAFADQLFKALMFSLGTNDARSNVIYLALAEFGQAAWDEDGKAAAA